MHLLYLIGEPGSGKSTVKAALTAGLLRVDVPKPVPHVLWGDEPYVVEVGRERGEFSGTDALSMSIQPAAVNWLSEATPPFVLGEGDRLGNRKFMDAMIAVGYTVTLAHLRVSASEGARRRQERAWQLDRPQQPESWVQGRRTKAENVAAAHPENSVVVLTDCTVQVAVACLATCPVVEALHSMRLG